MYLFLMSMEIWKELLYFQLLNPSFFYLTSMVNRKDMSGTYHARSFYNDTVSLQGFIELLFGYLCFPLSDILC